MSLSETSESAPHPRSWSEVLLRKAHGIHAEIGALQHYAAQESGTPLTPEALAGLFRGHHALLDDLYLNQLPYALAAEGADFFLGYRGPATARERAGLSQMGRLFGTLRTQIGGLARAVGQAGLDPRNDEEAQSIPETEDEEGGNPLDDLRVGCCLPGLCVGFAAPEGEAGEVWTETLGHLGFAARCLTEEERPGRFAAGIADPRIRDTALGALRKLFPHRDKGIESVELRGRLLGTDAPLLLDRKAWHRAGELLTRPLHDLDATGTVSIACTGRLLQIDYELRRFELREVESTSPSFSVAGKKGAIRCAYPPALDALCEGAARKRIEVRGRAALHAGRGGSMPRLIEVEDIRVLGE